MSGGHGGWPHNRNRKLVELEAQVNRRGTSTNDSYTVKQFADEIWSGLITSGIVQPRNVPSYFFDNQMGVTSIDLPASRSASRVDIPLFDADGKFECRIGKQTFQFDSKSHVDYVLMLHSIGIYGVLEIPAEERACVRVVAKIKKYLALFREQVDPMIENITKDPDLRDRIFKEVLKRITRHDSTAQ